MRKMPRWLPFAGGTVLLAALGLSVWQARVPVMLAGPLPGGESLQIGTDCRVIGRVLAYDGTPAAGRIVLVVQGARTIRGHGARRGGAAHVAPRRPHRRRGVGGDR